MIFFFGEDYFRLWKLFWILSSLVLELWVQRSRKLLEFFLQVGS